MTLITPLPCRYVAFGRVTSGLDVLKKVQNVPVTAPANTPNARVVIKAAGMLPPPTAAPTGGS
jgi:cyclophilin family peptidyl-prolyl cis-trans isomerase